MNILKFKLGARPYRDGGGGGAGGDDGGGGLGSMANTSNSPDNNSAATNAAMAAALGAVGAGPSPDNSGTSTGSGTTPTTVQGLTDRFGNPVYTGDTGKAIRDGQLHDDGTGTLTSTWSQPGVATNGQSFDSIRAGILNGTIDPNAMLSNTQTYAQALGVNDYATPALNTIGTMFKMATPGYGALQTLANAYNNPAGTAADLGGGLIGNYLSRQFGLGALSPVLTAALKGGLSAAVNGGDAAAGAETAAQRAGTAAATNFGTSALANVLHVDPRLLGAVGSATGITGSVGDKVGALTRAIAGN